jgi:hypothetical protein
MILLVAVFAVVAAAALAGWAATLVSMTRAMLPNAQALQALHKLNDMEDEKIRKVLANFERRERVEPQAGRPVADDMAEIQRRAASLGFVVDRAGTVSAPERPLIMPPDAGLLEVVE